MVKINDGTVTIPHAEFEKLIAARKRLQRLEAAGVNNWEGYPSSEDLDEDSEVEDE